MARVSPTRLETPKVYDMSDYKRFKTFKMPENYSKGQILKLKLNSKKKQPSTNISNIEVSDLTTEIKSSAEKGIYEAEHNR